MNRAGAKQTPTVNPRKGPAVFKGAILDPDTPDPAGQGRLERVQRADLEAEEMEGEGGSWFAKATTDQLARKMVSSAPDFGHLRRATTAMPEGSQMAVRCPRGERDHVHREDRAPEDQPKEQHMPRQRARKNAPWFLRRRRTGPVNAESSEMPRHPATDLSGEPPGSQGRGSASPRSGPPALIFPCDRFAAAVFHQAHAALARGGGVLYMNRWTRRSSPFYGGPDDRGSPESPPAEP